MVYEGRLAWLQNYKRLSFECNCKLGAIPLVILPMAVYKGNDLRLASRHELDGVHISGYALGVCFLFFLDRQILARITFFWCLLLFLFFCSTRCL